MSRPSLDSLAKVYDRRVTEVSDGLVHLQLDDDELRHAEFVTLIESALGADYDRSKIHRVAVLQGQLRMAMDALVKNLDAGVVSHIEFKVQLHKRSLLTMNECDEILGRDAFLRLFEATPDIAAQAICPLS